MGVLSAVTSREHAHVFDTASGVESTIEVEPATGYGVVRLQQEFGASQSTAGIMLTGLKRDLDDKDPLASILRQNAVTGNLDWMLRFKGGAYDIFGYTGFSRVEGTRDVILLTQRSSARYFQRPDAEYVDIDSNATSLSGYTFGLRGGKRSGRHWLWGGGFSFESPEFELNDAGILGQADDIEAWNHVIFREQTPGKAISSIRDSIVAEFVLELFGRQGAVERSIAHADFRRAQPRRHLSQFLERALLPRLRLARLERQPDTRRALGRHATGHLHGNLGQQQLYEPHEPVRFCLLFQQRHRQLGADVWVLGRGTGAATAFPIR